MPIPTTSPRFVSLALSSLAFACAAPGDQPGADTDAGSTGAETSSGSPGDESSTSIDETGDETSTSGAPEDPQGEELWRRTLGAGFASAVVGTADGGAVVVGTDDLFEGRGLAVRVDGDGEVLWKRLLAPAGQHAVYNDVAIAADGAIWVAGFRAWQSDLSPSRSMVLERLDDATGEVLWAEPGVVLEGFATPSHDLFAIVALADGVMVAGQDTDDYGAIHPLVRRYADDGTLVWSGTTPEQGRAHDLALVGADVLVVGARFDSSDEQPLGPWATVLGQDGSLVATPSLPPGRADLVLAITVPELGGLALGERYVEDGYNLDDDVGWMLPLTADGDAGTPIQLPSRLGGAVVTPDGELVVAFGQDVAAFDLQGTPRWELDDTVSMIMNFSDALALAADGNVFAAGGFEQLQLAKIAAPTR